MKRHIRSSIALGVLLGTALALTGCALFDTGPARGPDGQVKEATDIPSKTLLVGDCFTFVDGTEHAQATVMPCVDEHAYIVIGQGDLSAADISSAGSLQIAVSAACSEVFTAFKEAAAEGAKPEQEFIVSVETKEGVETTHYSCVASDAAAAA